MKSHGNCFTLKSKYVFILLESQLVIFRKSYAAKRRKYLRYLGSIMYPLCWKLLHWLSKWA